MKEFINMLMYRGDSWEDNHASMVWLQFIFFLLLFYLMSL